MFKFMRSILGASDTLNSLLGDVLFETPKVDGQAYFSQFQWRVKQGVNEAEMYISAKLRPDAYGGWKGAESHYISFDIATAERLRDDLNACIAEYHRLAAAAPRTTPPSATVSRG